MRRSFWVRWLAGRRVPARAVGRRRCQAACGVGLEPLEPRHALAGFDWGSSSGQVDENQPAGTAAAGFYNPNHDRVSFTTFTSGDRPLPNDNALFTLATSKDGWSTEVLTTRPFDFETRARYEICLKVTRADGSSDSRSVGITVGDVADTRSNFVVNTLAMGHDGKDGLLSLDVAIKKPDLEKTIRFAVSGTFDTSLLALGSSRFWGPVDIRATPKADGTPAVSVVGSLPDFRGAGNVVRGIAFAGATIRFVAASGGTIAGCRFQHGLFFESSDGNQVGGQLTGDRNVLFGGLRLSGSSNNVIEGNLIGIDANNLRSPDSKGIWIESAWIPVSGDAGGSFREAKNNRIGGATPGSRNVISGIRRDAIYVGMGAPGTVIQGNFIGTDVRGLSSGAPLKIPGLPYSELGNTTGIRITGSDGTMIGGSATGAGNVIAGSVTAIVIKASSALGRPVRNTTIQGNLIGVDAGNKNPLPNSDGIVIDRGAQTLVGGTVPRAGNVIANSGVSAGNGVTILGDDSRGNRILGNAIYASGWVGIQLGPSFVRNDTKGHNGPNAYQNHPTLIGNADGSVSGILKSDPQRKYRIELFASKPSGETSGLWPGAYRFIAVKDVVTDAKGVATFTFPRDPAATAFVATATSPEGNTSAFTMDRSLGAVDLTFDMATSQPRVRPAQTIAVTLTARGIVDTTVTVKAPPGTSLVQNGKTVASVTFKNDDEADDPFVAQGSFTLVVNDARKLPPGLKAITVTAVASTREYGGAATTRTVSKSLPLDPPLRAARG